MPQKKAKSHATPVEMTSVIPFTFEQHAVRVFLDDNQEPIFVAADVCDVLGLSNVSRAVARLEETEKGVTLSNTPGGTQSLLTVTEPGLYRLIFRSDKPEAKRFQTWVFSDVLPALRKHGQYTVPAIADPVEKYPELRAIRELLLATAEARDAAHAAEIRAVRAEAKADLAIADAKRMTIEQFVVKNGLLRQFPVSHWRSMAAWLTDFCRAHALTIQKEPVPGKLWPDENSYPLDAFGAWWRYEQQRARQIPLVEEEPVAYAVASA